MTAAEGRPRSVEAAFASWLIAAMLLVLFGLLVATSARAPVFDRGAGVIFALSGIAVGFMAGRTRRGDTRFRRATLALALAVAVLLALYVALTLAPIWALVMIPLIAGAYLINRPAAQEWFDAVDKPGSAGD